MQHAHLLAVQLLQPCLDDLVQGIGQAHAIEPLVGLDELHGHERIAARAFQHRSHEAERRRIVLVRFDQRKQLLARQGRETDVLDRAAVGDVAQQ